MILRREYKLNVIPGGFPLIIRCSKNDSSSAIVFSLFSGNGVLEIPSGASVSIRNKSTSASCTFEMKNKVPVVTASLTKAMTGKKGMQPFELVIRSGTYTFVTATFYLDVR